MSDSQKPSQEVLEAIAFLWERAIEEAYEHYCFRVFDEKVDLEAEIPGFKKILVDDGICLGTVPLEWKDHDLVMPASTMAAIDRLAAEGKISDEKTDPSMAQAEALYAKAEAQGLIKKPDFEIKPLPLRINV